MVHGPLALCIGKSMQHAACNWTLHHALARCTMPLPMLHVIAPCMQLTPPLYIICMYLYIYVYISRMVRFGSVRFGFELSRFGKLRFGSVSYNCGSVRFGLFACLYVCGSVRFGLRMCLYICGSVRFGLCKCSLNPGLPLPPSSPPSK